MLSHFNTHLYFQSGRSLSLAACFLCLTFPCPPPWLLSLLTWAHILQVHVYIEYYDGSPQFHGAGMTGALGEEEPPHSDLPPATRPWPSRTWHSSAEHTEHDPHFDQAEFLTVFESTFRSLSPIDFSTGLESEEFLSTVCCGFSFLEYSLFGFGSNCQYLTIMDFYLHIN